MDRAPYPSEEADRFQVRCPTGLRGRLKDAASSNHRSMNSEIVARLLASFGETVSEPETVPMSEMLEWEQGSDRFNIRMPDGMRDAIKDRAKSNARTANAEIVAIIAAALSGEGDRLARIEAKLDVLLSGGSQ